jgi:hypothetical protein
MSKDNNCSGYSIVEKYNSTKRERKRKEKSSQKKLQMKQKHSNLNFRSEYGEDMNENRKKKENI